MSTSRKINKILIANRGEIACRIIKSAKTMGIQTVAVHSEADTESLHVKLADEAFHIGPSAPTESYLNADKILDVAKVSNADAIHPGYGFLSENADFAKACSKLDIIFIGPSAESIRLMGLKNSAKSLMEKEGIPVVPGYHGLDQSTKILSSEAMKIGYPVLIKAIAGGGGKGMRRVDSPNQFETELKSAKREAKSSFGDDRILVEKYILKPRHIEIQVFGDNFGDAVHLFERDCSIQRRHQKILEEAPAPGMPEALREAMGAAAVKAAKAINYSGAGTVEFIVDNSKGLDGADFYFMEMNTRLQVEHPVTEMISGVDLVNWQIKVAGGSPLPKSQSDLSITGHSIEVRLYAEDPINGFLPSTGILHAFKTPFQSNNFRLETGVLEGDEISIYYDPMIAKLVVHEKTRELAIKSLSQVLRNISIAGLKTNQTLLLKTLSTNDFIQGNVHTGFIEAQGEKFIKETPGLLVNNAPYAAITHILYRDNLAFEEHKNSKETNSPWNNIVGWRLNLPRSEKLTLSAGDTSFEVQVTTLKNIYEVRIFDKTHHISANMDNNGLISILVNGQNLEFQTCQYNDTINLMAGGATLEYITIPFISCSDEDDSGPGAVTSPMPGLIIEVLVKVGDIVTQNDPLIIMEAMKMEYTLRAGKSGIVDDIKVSIDDQVTEGLPLVFISDRKLYKEDK